MTFPGKKSYNQELLHKMLTRDNAILIGSYTKLNRGTVINFICNCGTQYSKKFIVIAEQSGAYCKKDTEARKLERRKKTNLEKYGCESVAQVNVFKEKIKETNLQKYGVESAAQSNEVKSKIKETNY